MLWKGLRQPVRDPGLLGRAAGERSETIRVQVEARERTHEVVAPGRPQSRVEGRRVRHVLLHEVLVVLGDRDVEAVARDDPALGDRVVRRMSERDEAVVPLEGGEGEPRDPVDRVHRDLARPFQRLEHRPQLVAGRSAVEAADPDVDGVNGAPTDHVHQAVAGLLHRESPLDHLAVVGGHVDRALVPEEVGGVQQVHVQGVALDPLAEVDQPPERRDRSVDRHPARVLDRSAGAHLVRDRADPADPRGDVRRLGVTPSPEERLEEPGRLVDVQPSLHHLAVADVDLEAALAFYAGEAGDADRGVGARRATVRHGPRSPRGTPPRSR